jgi:hypothetical protein
MIIEVLQFHESSMLPTALFFHPGLEGNNSGFRTNNSSTWSISVLELVVSVVGSGILKINLDESDSCFSHRRIKFMQTLFPPSPITCRHGGR